MSHPIAFGRALRRGWWIVLLTLLVSLGASAWVTSRQQPRYRARASVAVAPNTRVRSVSDTLRSLDTLERRTVIATFARLPAAPETRAAAAREMGRDASDLRRYRVDASVLPQTNIIRLTVEGRDAETAAAFANALAQATRREVRSLYGVYTLKTLTPAVASRRAIYPDPQRNAVVAGLLGLLVGVAAALMADRLRPPVANA